LIQKTHFDRIFNRKTVFITGHTGFIGSWLSLWLQSCGAKVVGYSLDPLSNPSMFEIIKLENYISHIFGDIRDLSHLSNCLSKYEPEFVFHLAAQSLVGVSYQIPLETLMTNIIGTANVLEAIRNQKNIKACIVMTSDKCYENREQNCAFKENDPMGGYDPYSASKGAAELVTTCYRNSFFNPSEISEHHTSIATIRAGNVIGGGDWSDDRIIPDSVRSLISKKPILVRNPNSIRPWQHVLEPVSGTLCLARKMIDGPNEFAEAWNIGPKSTNNITTVKKLVSTIINEWGEGSWEDISKKNDQIHEANFLSLDSTKAMSRLDWKPIYSINEAISKTISWYNVYYNKKQDMLSFTISQIEDYIKKASQIGVGWVNSP